jgi:plasmid stability protein
MAQVLVRNLPEDAVARLKARAANENKSLQELLREMIEREAKPSKAETLDQLRKLRSRRPMTDFDIAAAIHEGRAERDRAILGRLFDSDDEA